MNSPAPRFFAVGKKRLPGPLGPVPAPAGSCYLTLLRRDEPACAQGFLPLAKNACRALSGPSRLSPGPCFCCILLRGDELPCAKVFGFAELCVKKRAGRRAFRHGNSLPYPGRFVNPDPTPSVPGSLSSLFHYNTIIFSFCLQEIPLFSRFVPFHSPAPSPAGRAVHSDGSTGWGPAGKRSDEKPPGKAIDIAFILR